MREKCGRHAPTDPSNFEGGPLPEHPEVRHCTQRRAEEPFGIEQTERRLGTTSGDQPESETTRPAPKSFTVWVWIRVNDPSAGSPTETLLRLLLPLDDKAH